MDAPILLIKNDEDEPNGYRVGSIKTKYVDRFWKFVHKKILNWDLSTEVWDSKKFKKKM